MNKIATNVGPKVWKGRESERVSKFGSFPCKSNVPIGESSSFSLIEFPSGRFLHAFLTLVAHTTSLNCSATSEHEVA